MCHIVKNSLEQVDDMNFVEALMLTHIKIAAW